MAQHLGVSLLGYGRIPGDRDVDVVRFRIPRRGRDHRCGIEHRLLVFLRPNSCERGGLLSGVVDRGQLPLVSGVLQKLEAGGRILLEPLRELEVVDLLIVVFHRNVTGHPLAAAALNAEADRVAAHAGAVILRFLPAQGRVHRVGFQRIDRRGISPGDAAVQNRALAVHEPRGGGVVVVDLEDLAVDPVLIFDHPVAVRVDLVDRLHLPVEVFQVGQPRDYEFRSGHILLHVGRGIPVDSLRFPFVNLNIADDISDESLRILLTRRPGQVRHGGRGGEAAELKVDVFDLAVNVGFFGHQHVAAVAPDAGAVAVADVLADAPFDGLPLFDIREGDALLAARDVLNDGFAGRIAADNAVFHLKAALRSVRFPAQGHGPLVDVE